VLHSTKLCSNKLCGSTICTILVQFVQFCTILSTIPIDRTYLVRYLTRVQFRTIAGTIQYNSMNPTEPLNSMGGSKHAQTVTNGIFRNRT
jgi:hypothetical protein